MKSRTIKVDYLARVEGEGALLIRYKGREPVEVKFKIFEPPRFFEAFLRGRKQEEVPDITARICGICPVAYQMSSCHALEDAQGIRLDGTLRELRRLLYCGEWIESHVLHMFMLQAPDLLGYPDAMAMAKDHPDKVKLALACKKAGNRIVQVLGGREIHPINVRLGGFYRAPERRDLEALIPDLEASREAIAAACRWVRTLSLPAFERDYEFVSLRHPDEYPFNEGRIVSSKGLDLAIEEYPDHFREVHVEHSNALQSVRRGGTDYFVGPLARFNLNSDRLPAGARALAAELGLNPPVRNPFLSILARGVEVWFAYDEALRIIRAYRKPDPPALPVPTRAGTGHGATEAPRGLLYHRYQVEEGGAIGEACIIPPTSQNQLCIEGDLWEIAKEIVDMPHQEATLRAELAVRNYDPCISCATHFLKLDIRRE